jgi:hypothetical protein
LDVVLQLGDYHLGEVPDMFVTGPEIVIYGDGTVYAELFDGVANGEAQYRRLKGRTSEEQLQKLLRDAKALPPTSPVGVPPTDGSPLLLLVSGTQTWDINDLSAEPFAAYLDEVRSAVRSAAREAWSPSRWIVRPYGVDTCSVVEEPLEQSEYDAPVYPHLLDHYRLGATPCNPAP